MMTLKIPNISCGHCARAITQALQELDPAARIDVDVAAKTVALTTAVDLASVCAKLAAEGYPATAL